MGVLHVTCTSLINGREVPVKCLLKSCVPHLLYHEICTDRVLARRIRSSDSDTSYWTIVSLIIAVIILSGMIALIFYICFKIRVLNPVGATSPSDLATPAAGTRQKPIPILRIDDISTMSLRENSNNHSNHGNHDDGSSSDDSDTSSPPPPFTTVTSTRESTVTLGSSNSAPGDGTNDIEDVTEEERMALTPLPRAPKVRGCIIQVRESPTTSSANLQYLQQLQTKKTVVLVESIVANSRQILAELRSYSSPPKSVKLILMSTFILLGEDVSDVGQWKQIIRLLNKTGPNSLTERLMGCNISAISRSRKEKAKQYLKSIFFRDFVMSNEVIGGILDWNIKACNLDNST